MILWLCYCDMGCYIAIPLGGYILWMAALYNIDDVCVCVCVCVYIRGLCTYIHTRYELTHLLHFEMMTL